MAPRRNVDLSDQDAADEQQERDVLYSFRSLLSSAGEGKIQIHRRDPDTKRMKYCMTVPYFEGSNDVLDEVRNAFPDGGEFQLKFQGRDGLIKGSDWLFLDPIPDALRPEKKTPERSSQYRDDGQFGTDKLMMMMMKQSQEAADRQMNMMMAMFKNSSDNQVAMFQAIGAMMGKAPSESPSQLLKNIVDLQKDLKGEDTEATFERFMKNLEMAKAFVGTTGGSGDDSGFGGLLEKLGPLVAAMAAQMNQPKQPQTGQPMPAGTVTPILPPAMPPNVTPMPGVTPQPVFSPAAPVQVQPQPQAQTQDAQDPAMLEQIRLFNTYNPLMQSIKKLMEKGKDAEDIVAFIGDQIDIEAIDGDDVANLVDGAMSQMDLVPTMAAQFGITNPEHVEVLREAIRIYAADMDAGEESSGQEGDVAVPGDHGGERDQVSGASPDKNPRARPGKAA